MLGILMMSLMNILIIRKYNSYVDNESGLEKRFISEKSLLIGLLAGSFCIATLIRDFAFMMPAWTTIPPKDFFDRIVFASIVIPLLVGVVTCIIYMCFVTSVVKSKRALGRLSVISIGTAVLATLIYPVGDRMTFWFFFRQCSSMRFGYMFIEACVGILFTGYIIGKSEITTFRVPPRVPDPSVARLLCKILLIVWIVIAAKLYASTSFVYLPLIIYGCVKAARDVVISLQMYHELNSNQLLLDKVDN